MNARKRRRGIALAEVLVAGAMLAIGLTAIISISGRSLKMQTDGEKRMTAAWLADELLNLVVVEGPDDFSKRNETSGRFSPPFDQYTFQVDITTPSAIGVPHFVSAVVGWDAPSNPSVRVDTLISMRQYREEDEKRDLREAYEPLDRDGRLEEAEMAREGVQP